MNYIIVRNGMVVFQSIAIADCINWMNANKASLCENDQLFLYKIDKTAAITVTIKYN